MSDPILPGAEPESWSGDSTQGRADAALVLHGFTGTPQSMRALAEALAATGLAVELPLLPGHGTSIEDMVPTRWRDWFAAAEAAYCALAARSRRVVVVGLSMGGTLACALAAGHPEVAGIAVINPFVEPPAQSFFEILRGVLSAGVEVAPGLGADLADPGAAELSYSGTPIRAALSLFEATATLELGRIACPVLLLQSRGDHVVPP
ncbi:MAG: alpha/beta hydrolase, partial [Acidimicrobiales bacterium]